MKKPKARKTNASPKSRCRAMILLDSAKIKKDLLKVYKRKKKALEKLEQQLTQYNEQDIAEYQKYLAQRFGREMSRRRELHEQICLLESRREKLFFMIEQAGMTRSGYCRHIAGMVDEKNDFWSILEQEYVKWAEQQQKDDEEFEEYCREMDEEFRKFCDETDDDEGSEDYFGDDDDFEEMGDDPFKSVFRSIFEIAEETAQGGGPGHDQELKQLYRELCLRYHPDKTGGHDDQTKHLWFAIQAAYD